MTVFEGAWGPEKLTDQRRDAKAIFKTAVAAVQPEACISRMASRKVDLLITGPTRINVVDL